MRSSEKFPLVTIGIPLYNEEEFIEETLKSALNQTYKNLEVIVSENGSSDQSLSIVERIAQNDNRVKIVAHGTNKGPWFNFEFPLLNATGKYFMWFGAHDIMIEDYVENAVEVLTNEIGVVAVHPKIYEIKDGVIKEEFINADYSDNTNTVSGRILKSIITNGRGGAVHSIFRIEVLKKSFVDINGGDLRIILTAVSMGQIKATKNVALIMRNVRPTEDLEQRKVRYKTYGFADNWKEIRYMFPFELVSNLNYIRLKDRLVLLSNLAPALKKLYGNFSRKRFLYYHLKKLKLKTAMYVMLEYIIPH